MSLRIDAAPIRMEVGGAQGPSGTSLTIGAVGLLADLGDYDAEDANFTYLTSDTSEIYVRLTATAGVWSDGVPFVGGTGGGTGTVTSVGGTGTVSGLTLSGTVTSSGSLTLGGTLSVAASNFASQTANYILAAPNGSNGTPTFRAIVAADIPTLNQNTTGSAGTVTTINGRISAGSNVTLSGTGTALDPYVIASTATGGGGGTVTSVSVTTANGISGSVATATSTPAITLTLGAITPSSVNGLTITANGTNTLSIAAGKTLTVSNTITLSGTDSSTLAIGTGGTLGTAAYTAATSYAAASHTHAISSGVTGLGTGVAAALAVNVNTLDGVHLVGGALGTPASGNFSTGTFTWPTFNQNTTGSAATVTTINGRLTSGTSTVVTGSGTTASPYAVNALIGSGDIRATGTITYSGLPTTGQTLTIGIRVYTYQATGPLGSNDILIGTDTETMVANTITGLNGPTTGTANGDVIAEAASTTVVRLTARTAGTGGNSVALSETANNTAVSGSTLTGGGTLGTAAFTAAAAYVPAAGALGTPTSGTLTNCTGLPVSTGITGLGTGVATALGVNTGSAGAPVLFNGAGGTPTSLTLTNATGLPTAGLVDDAVTLAKMASGTAGNLITYDASGNPAAVATGTATHVLTSNGAGAAPTFQAVSGGGGGGVTVQEEGTPLTTVADTLNFIGPALTAAGTGATKTITGPNQALDTTSNVTHDKLVIPYEHLKYAIQAGSGVTGFALRQKDNFVMIVERPDSSPVTVFGVTGVQFGRLITLCDFSSPFDPTCGIYAEAAGVVQINNGTANAYRDLKLRNLTATGTVKADIVDLSGTLYNLNFNRVSDTEIQVGLFGADSSGSLRANVLTGITEVVSNGLVTGKYFKEGVTALGPVVSAATITITGGSSVTATLTASTACTFTMPTAASGLSFVLHLKQAATTGNGTATFTGVVWSGGTAPTMTATAGKMDSFSFIAGPNAAGTGWVWYGSVIQNLTPP